MAISVIMTVFNGQQWLEEAIQSVLDQTFSEFEFIIVDDGSTDGTPEILKRAAARDGRVRVISQENMGVSRSVNRVLLEARYGWIARMDADDVMAPDRLERQLAFVADNPDVSVVSCFADYIDEGGKTIGECHNPLTSRSVVRNWIDSGKVIHMIQSGAMFRRDVVLSVGGYRPEFNVTEDTDLWNRVAEAGHTVIVQPEVLMQVRVHSRSLTRSSLWLQARQFRWLEDGARRRRASQPEISFDEFMNQDRHRPILSLLNIARRDLGQLLYKRAAISRTAGSTSAMLTFFTASMLVYPSHAIDNVWRKRLRTMVLERFGRDDRPAVSHRIAGPANR